MASMTTSDQIEFFALAKAVSLDTRMLKNKGRWERFEGLLLSAQSNSFRKLPGHYSRYFIYSLLDSISHEVEIN